MAFDIMQIETIVIVMMENRSFDHMLGHLSLRDLGGRNEVDGLKDDPHWIEEYINDCDGAAASGPFHLKMLALSDDPPHEREYIAKQIGAPYPWHGGRAPMNGFMKSYSTAGVWSDQIHEVMGYYTGAELAITRYFADQFAICDSWFACIPTSTQPNRLMAMAGYTLIDNTLGTIIPDHDLVYDWLEQRSNLVDWYVYHEGFPFFMLMPKWTTRILTDAHFQSLDKLDDRLSHRPGKPQVLFVEPKYTNDPLRTSIPTDDHSPSSIAGGQDFLSRVYKALRQNDEVWNRSLMIITYDENGGLFDHASPLPVRTDPPVGAQWKDPTPFTTTGIRVPAMMISPLIKGPCVYKGPLDHTSILRFLGQRFGGVSYNMWVAQRKGVGSIKDVLDQYGCPVRSSIPPAPAYSPPENPPEGPLKKKSPMDAAFEAALDKVRVEQPLEGAAKFPALRDFLTNPLWQEAQRQIRIGGFTLDPTVEYLFGDFVKFGELKLLSEPSRRDEAAQNLAAFIDVLRQETMQLGTTTINSTAFSRAKEIDQLWPFA